MLRNMFIGLGLFLALGVTVFFIKACWEVLTSSSSKAADDPDRIIKPWS